MSQHFRQMTWLVQFTRLRFDVARFMKHPHLLDDHPSTRPRLRDVGFVLQKC